MRSLLEHVRRRQPRWLDLEVRPARGHGFRILLPLEPFETPLAFALVLAVWWTQRRLGARGGWRLLFEPPRLGLDQLRPDEPLLDVRSRGYRVVLRVGGLL
ncbi:hypothetical protein [Oceanithermus sp.]